MEPRFVSLSGQLAGAAILAMALVWAGPAWGQDCNTDAGPGHTCIYTTGDWEALADANDPPNYTHSGGDVLVFLDSGLTFTLPANAILNVDADFILSGDITTLILGEDSVTTINGSGLSTGSTAFSLGGANGAVLDMKIGSRLTVDGDIVSWRGGNNYVFKFQELDVTGDGRFYNATVNFNQNATFRGEEVGFGLDSVATLADGVKLSAPSGEVWVEEGSTLNMGAGSSIETQFMFIDSVDDNGFNWNVGPGQYEVHTDYYNKPSILSLLGNAKIDSSGGFFVGHGGIVDVGLNTLTIDGDVHFFGDGPGTISDGSREFTLICSGSSCASTYKLEFTDDKVGLISVSGQVTIEEDAKVEITSHTGNDKPDYDRTILTAGSFATNYLFDSGNPEQIIEKKGNNLVLKGDKDLLTLAEEAGLNNNNNFAQAMGILNSTGIINNPLVENIIKTLDSGSPSEKASAEKALKQILGEEALPTLNAFHDTLGQMNSALNSRFQTLRSNTPPAAGYGPTENRLWVGAFGQWNRQKDADDVYGYDYNSGGIMLGYDREVAALPGLTFGLYGSLADGRLNNNSGLATTDIKALGLGLYGSYEFGGGFFVDANLGYGHAQNDAKITIDPLLGGGQKSSDSSSNSYQAGFNFGYAFQLGEAATLTPSAGLQYTHVKQNGWQEKLDSGNDVILNWFGDSKQNFWEIPLSLRLATTVETEGGSVISPELRLGGVIAANNPKSELRMGFVGAPNDSAVISGISPGKSRFTAGAGVKAQLNDTVDIFVNYDLEARSGYQGHSASAGLGFSF